MESLYMARNDTIHHFYILCSASVKQNTAVKTGIDACSLLAKYTFSDLVQQRPSPLIINFGQIIKPFLV